MRPKHEMPQRRKLALRFLVELRLGLRRLVFRSRLDLLLLAAVRRHARFPSAGEALIFNCGADLSGPQTLLSLRGADTSCV